MARNSMVPPPATRTSLPPPPARKEEGRKFVVDGIVFNSRQEALQYQEGRR